VAHFIRRTKYSLLIVFLFFLNSAVTGHAASLPQPVSAVAGDWQGMMHCYGYNIRFGMRLEERSDGKIGGSLEASTRSVDRGNGKGRTERFAVVLQGSYDPSLALFDLQTQNAPHQQRFEFIGVLEPQGERLVARVKSPYYGNCSYAIAGKSEIKRAIKHIESNSDFEPKIYRSRNPQECDSSVVEWLAQANMLAGQSLRGQEKYAALWLFEDQRFKKYFGNTFEDMSRGDAAKLAFQLKQGCQQQLLGDRRKGMIAQFATQVLFNAPELSRGEAFVYPIAAQIVRDWKSLAKASIAETSDVGENEWIAKAAMTQEVTAILWPEGGMGLDTEIMQARQRTNSDQLLTEVKRQINAGPKDFAHLLRLSEIPLDGRANRGSRRQQRVRGRMDNASPGVTEEGRNDAAALLTQTINEHVIPAAQTFAEAGSTPKDVETHLQPLRQNSQLVSLTRYLEPAKIEQIDDIFRTRRRQLLAGFAASEMAMLAANEKSGKAGLDDLAAAVALEAQLQNRYGKLLDQAEFAEFGRVREEKRRALLSMHQAAVARRIAQAEMMTEIDDLLRQYLSEADKRTEAGQALLAAQEARRNVVAPFSAFPGGDYLNAIYAGDITELRRLDRAYIAELRPLIEDSMKMTKQVTTLIGAVSGGAVPSGLINDLVDQRLEKITLYHRVLATYLFNYSRKYCADPGNCTCLRDPVKFTVTTTRPDIVTKNLLGVEISRIYGSVDQDEYWVNSDFGRPFRYIGTMDEHSVGAALTDKYLNQGRINNLIAGTLKMMGQFKCDSAEIRRMEKGLLSMFDRMK